MSATASALCVALAAAGVTLRARDRTHLLATPRAAVTEELATMLRRFKPELLGAIDRGRRTRLGPAIAACRGCDLEFVHPSEPLCPWCSVTEFGALLLDSSRTPHRNSTPRKLIGTR
jgi:hypothetical protein